MNRFDRMRDLEEEILSGSGDFPEVLELATLSLVDIANTLRSYVYGSEPTVTLVPDDA